MGSKYQEVLEHGSRQIIDLAMEIARSENVSVTRIFWGEGELLPNYVSQTLTIETEGDRVRGVFHESWISHAQGKLEHKEAENVLREMIGKVGHA